MVGTIITAGFISFLVIGFLSGIGKRLAKNIYNLIALAISITVTVIMSGTIYKNLIHNPLLQELILKALERIGGVSNTLLATGESLILLLLSVIVGPLFFLGVYGAVKFLMAIIKACIPPLNRLMQKKIGKVRVKISWKKRLIGGFIGLFISASVFFAISATPMAMTDLVHSAIKEVPEILLETEDNQTAENSGLSTFSEDIQEESSTIDDTLNGLLQGLSATKNIVDPISESFPFLVFKKLGLNNFTEEYLNNSSSIEYELHGKNFKTEIYSDFKGLIKGAVVFSSYYLLEKQETGLGAQTFSNDKIGEGVYAILKNNFIIETIDPIIKGLIHELCVANFELTEEETTQVVESIELSEFIDMNESEKLTESKQIAKFFIDFLTIAPEIGNEEANALDYVSEFGGIMDDMASTNSFATTPGTLLRVFVNGNEEINDYVSHDSLEILVNNVETKKCTYTQCLKNIKITYNISMTLGGVSEGELDDDSLKKDFGEIYNNTNDGVREVVGKMVEDSVLQIQTTPNTEEITHAIVKEYFDNIYEYAGDLKEEAGDDEAKQQEAEEKFKQETESVQIIVDVIKEVSISETLSLETVENFADALVSSEVVKKTVEDLRDGEGAEFEQARNQLQEVLNDSEDLKQDIANALNERIENAEADDVQNIEILKQLLGIE